VKRNRYRKALKILKSTEVDKKLKALDETIVNSTRGVYSVTKYSDEVSQNLSSEYWGGGNGPYENLETDFSADYLEEDPSGKSTKGLIAEDGTVLSKLPPGGEQFILGPIVDGFIFDEEYGSYTNIGYIQKDTRQFVLLARIEGQWKDGLNGEHQVWDGTSNGLTIYNQKFTLEMAQWVRDCILNKDYSKNVPYFYSGNRSQKLFGGKNSPSNMYVGNGIGPNKINDVYKKQIFRNEDGKKYFELGIDKIVKSGESKEIIQQSIGQILYQNDFTMKEIENLLKMVKIDGKGTQPKTPEDKFKDSLLNLIKARRQ